MAHWLEETENMVYAGRIKVPYRWYVGEVGSRFLTALRDKREIWGTRCSKCKRVYVPPAKNCGECFTLTDEWVQVKNTGTLQSFTVVRYSHDMQPRSVPFAYGLIKLDDADGSLLHFIGDTDLDALQVGMRVEAVFAEEREGSILDIQHFRPVEGGD
jgi:uncharacterized OB-fold protein